MFGEGYHLTLVKAASMDDTHRVWVSLCKEHVWGGLSSDAGQGREYGRHTQSVGKSL